MKTRAAVWVFLVIGSCLASRPVFAQCGDCFGISTCISYYVPESGSVNSPTTGNAALRNFRVCPNNEGGQSLPNNARIKIVVLAADHSPIAGIPAINIGILINGGTLAQGFSGIGTDSIIANSTWNPTCPDLRQIDADGPTDANGTTYITLTGALAGNPGVGVRDPNRKWGHYDSVMGVFVGGCPLQGRFTESDLNGSFVLQVKNFDSVGGLLAVSNQGEIVNSLDINPVSTEISHGTYNFWHDFDWNGVVNSLDLNLLNPHNGHKCTYPSNP